ncbi:nucleolar protein 8-like [Oppia nitens]|uniref:nucleolar protein 8-like n=1 Tax=Oppia nitens TaxID=1686743 RepID=UPI0023D98243|nr:nucleolar protein 8-like [Oppia nitens]
MFSKFKGIKSYETDDKLLAEDSNSMPAVIVNDVDSSKNGSPVVHQEIMTTEDHRPMKRLRTTSGGCDDLDSSVASTTKLVSNEKRLKTLKDKQDFDKRQQLLVKEAISGDKRQNKRIVFTDDDDNDTKANDELFGGKVNDYLSQIRRESSDANNGLKATNKKPTISLFESDSDDNDGSGDDNVDVKEFESKLNTKISDKNVEKLIELNSRFAHDVRFKIDERFLDQNEDNDEEEGDEFETEKQKNLNLLESVLNKTNIKSSIIKIKDKSSQKLNEDNLFISRFDPKGANPSAFEVTIPSDENVLKSSKKVTFDESVLNKDESKNEVSKEVYYEVSSDLKESFSKKGENFSLTQLFGTSSSAPDSDEDNDTEEPAIVKPITYDKLDPKKAKSLPNPFRYDSSSSDDEVEVDDVNHVKIIKNTSDVTQVPEKPLPNGFKFFFTKNDCRFDEDIFYSKEAIDKAKNSWKDRQTMIIRSMGVRKRSAKKNKKADNKWMVKFKKNGYQKRFGYNQRK